MEVLESMSSLRGRNGKSGRIFEVDLAVKWLIAGNNVLGVCGTHGCGITTFLNMIAGTFNDMEYRTFKVKEFHEKGIADVKKEMESVSSEKTVFFIDGVVSGNVALIKEIQNGNIKGKIVFPFIQKSEISKELKEITESSAYILSLKKICNHEVYAMINNQVKSMAKSYGVKISDDEIKEIIQKSATMETKYAYPKSSMIAFENIFKLASQNENGIIRNTDILMGLFGPSGIIKKSIVDEEFIEKVAIHEAGHFIAETFFVEKQSKYPVSVAVAVVPNFNGICASSYGGMEVVSTYELGMNMIKESLAGEIACEVMGLIDRPSEGISSDLEYATKLAFQMVDVSMEKKRIHFCMLPQSEISQKEKLWFKKF